jgi:hypothetical protein
MSTFPISPLSLNQFTRDLWGFYDPLVIAQLARFGPDARYQPKFYSAPDLDAQVFTPYAQKDCGIVITPGSWIYALCLPTDPVTLMPRPFNLQITDNSLKDGAVEPHKFWSEPVPSALIGNYCPTFVDQARQQVGSSFNLFCTPHLVTGDGLFSVEIWETSGAQQRIEVLLAVAEALK